MSDAPACECPTDDYCPKCHPRWYAKWAENTHNDAAEGLRRAVTGQVNKGLDNFRMGEASNDTITNRIVAAALPFVATAWDEGRRVGRGRGPGHTDACPIGGSRADNPYRDDQAAQQGYGR